MVQEEKMEIRKAVESDAANIAAVGMCVWVDTYATEGVFDNISRYVFCEFTKDKIIEVIRKKTVLIVSDDSCLLGYIMLNREQENKVEIETLYILPRFHRNGIGRLLIEEALKSFPKSFWVSVWELNHKAISFYTKIGFKETGELYFDLYGDKIRNIVLEFST